MFSRLGFFETNKFGNIMEVFRIDAICILIFCLICESLSASYEVYTPGPGPKPGKFIRYLCKPFHPNSSNHNRRLELRCRILKITSYIIKIGDFGDSILSARAHLGDLFIINPRDLRARSKFIFNSMHGAGKRSIST